MTTQKWENSEIFSDLFKYFYGGHWDMLKYKTKIVME